MSADLFIPVAELSKSIRARKLSPIDLVEERLDVTRGEELPWREAQRSGSHDHRV